MEESERETETYIERDNKARETKINKERHGDRAIEVVKLREIERERNREIDMRERKKQEKHRETKKDMEAER